MKFYPVEVDGVPQLARTKLEAKQLGFPNVEPIDIDVAQEPLMARLNDLMRKAHAQETADDDTGGNPVVAAQPVAPKEEPIRSIGGHNVNVVIHLLHAAPSEIRQAVKEAI